MKLDVQSLRAVLPVLVLLGAGRLAQCDCIPQGHGEHGPEARMANSYRNKAWGYNVTIPQSLVGWDDSAGPHHGFGISFGDPPESYILVYGEANSFDYTSPVDAALYHLSDLRKHVNAEIESVRISRRTLGSLLAVELVATYVCPGSLDRYTVASVLALGPKRTPSYEVTLYCRADRYIKDRRYFDEIVKSWHFTGY